MTILYMYVYKHGYMYTPTNMSDCQQYYSFPSSLSLPPSPSTHSHPAAVQYMSRVLLSVLPVCYGVLDGHILHLPASYGVVPGGSHDVVGVGTE